MRILLVDAYPERAAVLEQALLAAGHHIVAHFDHGCDLREAVLRVAPDMVTIDIDSPNRDILEDMHALNREQPRPVVIFTQDAAADLIRNAVAAGVSAYVVGDVDPVRVAPVLTVAISRFEQFQAVKRELDDARSALADRKLIERAKGILMKQKNIAEEEAFQLLRKFAMDRGIRMADAAGKVIEMAAFIG